MRKVVYSSITKLVAVVLFIACIISGVLIAADGVLEYYNQEEEIYLFESDFSESWYISNLLGDPQTIVYNAYRSVFYEYDSMGHRRPVEGDITSEENRVALEKYLKERFSEYYNSERVNYYVQWNDLVFTNCGAKSAEELMQSGYYSYLMRDPSGFVERKMPNDRHIYSGNLLEEFWEFDKTSTIIVCCNVNEETVTEYKAIWELQEDIVINA